MPNWTIRSVDTKVIRGFGAEAKSRGMTLARYLAWNFERKPAEWNAHATNCGACGGYIQGLDEDDDGCRDGCPLH